MRVNTTRHLIVNADDLGLSQGVNQGIIQAHEKGIVTSASLMTRYPAALDAGAYSRAHPELALGLHFDIGEWAYRDDRWVPVYQVVPEDDVFGIETELKSQLERFREIVGHDPTHLDSHQHVHRREPVRSLLLRVAQELAIPLRECSTWIRYDGRFYGQDSRGAPWPQNVSIAGLLEILSSLPPGISELACHPGLDSQLESPYRQERAMEMKALCHATTRSALQTSGIELISFHDVQQFAPLPSV